MLDEAPDTTHTNVVTVSAADDETLVNLAAVREFQDDSLLPVIATSQASVLTVGPDLELTKGDAGFVATAGQQTPFPYTITVINVGEGEVNPADTVTVVDDLPDAFEWVAPAPAGLHASTGSSSRARSRRPACARRAPRPTIVATARVKARRGSRDLRQSGLRDDAGRPGDRAAPVHRHRGGRRRQQRRLRDDTGGVVDHHRPRVGVRPTTPRTSRMTSPRSGSRRPVAQR